MDPPWLLIYTLQLVPKSYTKLYKRITNCRLTLNLTKNDITEISTGQYAKSQVEKSVAKGLLSPLGGIISAIDKQARIQVAIVYWDDQNNQNVTVIDVRSRDALLFRTDLELMTGLKIKR